MERLKCVSAPVQPLDKYRHSDGEWRDGVRPLNIVETDDDLQWLAVNSPAMQAFVVCGFCGSEKQIRNLAEGRKWFYGGHDCDEAYWPEGWEHDGTPADREAAQEAA